MIWPRLKEDPRNQYVTLSTTLVQIDPANLSPVHRKRESADAMPPQRGQQNEDLLNVLIDINSNKRLRLIC